MDRIDTLHLFDKLDEQLMVLLKSLSPADWNKPTAAKKWRVKDIAAHLLDGNLRALSMLRDGYVGVQPQDFSYSGLVAYLNELNAAWVTAYQRISPSILIQQLELSAREYNHYLASLDLEAKAVFSVAWAGEDESKNWFHIAREYTEKWHHQMQLREAVGAPLLLSAEWYAPVLHTCMRALPHAYRNVPAREGATVEVVIDGDAGGVWRIVKAADQWEFSESEGAVTATVNLPSQDAWRVFTKGLPFEAAIHHARIQGDCNLGEHVLQMVTVMA
ncbi:MAG: maleylpyruvate isomerase N-terminal domain-containing protein [Flammeovirgaceae bacterium]